MQRIPKTELTEFCINTFSHLGVSREDSKTSAEVLVQADARGIPSHGVARLGRYVNGLQEGLMNADAESAIVRETPVSVLIDADRGLGAPVSRNAMETVLDKAGTTGMAIGAVRNSNHFGIAGSYAMMALEKDMVGFAMTNTAALGVPTFGKEVKFGTNPLAFAAPADMERAFVLDMSTTVVTRGKIEVYNRNQEELKSGWAVDKNGKTAVDPASLLADMFDRKGGGISPLGGDSETYGGHKGYGLAVMVDILTGVLSGSLFGGEIYDKGSSSALVSHCFGAFRIDLFQEPQEFRRNMDRMLKDLRNMPPAEGKERVYYAGLKEFEAEEESIKLGIPLTDKVLESLRDIGNRMGISGL